MSELQEKREYYGDRSLKAVYFVDEQGRKQGDYTEYKQNSHEILNQLEYKDDAVWNGRVDTKDCFVMYENGQEVTRYEVKNGIETEHRNGKLLWKTWSEKRANDVNCEISQRFEEGKVVGESRTYKFDDIEEGFYGSQKYERTLRIYIEHCDDISVVEISGFNVWYYDGARKMGTMPEIKCKLKDGELTDYESETMDYTNEWHNEPKKLHAHFADGKPVGDYCVPLNYDFPYTKRIKDKLYEKIGNSITRFSHDSFKSKSEQCIFNGYFKHNIIAEGSWTDGKFTGKAESIGGDPHFLVKWNDGKMQGHCGVLISHTGDSPGIYTEIYRKLEWHDDLCDVTEDERVKYLSCKTLERREKYTLKDGKKNGLYIKEQFFERGSIREQCEYKDDMKNGIEKIYNKDAHWLESETQYQNGKKHGYETKYNSDGTIASQKYYENGINCTMVHKAIKKAWNKVATKRIEKEKAIEAKTGKKTRLPKMSKLEKTVAMVKENLGLSK